MSQNPMCAFYLDLKTSHYRPDYLKNLFPRLNNCGYTHVVFEIEDKIRLDNLVDATWFEAYTKEEFADILDACRKAHLTPIPLVQTLGHFEFLLSHPRYHHLRETAASSYMLCPSKSETLDYLKQLLDEVYELFDNPSLFHIGADETRCLGHCQACKEFAEENGLSALYVKHLNAVTQHLVSRGCRPMAWADMILHYPEAISEVDKNVVWVDWEYVAGDGTPEWIRIWGGKPGTRTIQQLKEMPKSYHDGVGRFVFADENRLNPWPYVSFLLDEGFDVIVAPATRSAGDHPFAPDFKHLPNVAGAVRRLQEEPQPMGLMVTSWALRLNTLESQWPAIAMPQLLKQNPSLADNELYEAAAELAFQKADPKLVQAIQAIGTTLPTTHSWLGIGSATYLYERPDSMFHLLNNYEKQGELQNVLASAADFKKGYVEGGQLLADATATLSERNDCLEFWDFAARAMAAKADEVFCIESARRGNDVAQEAARLMMLFETLRDEYKKLLEPIYTPGSIERELSMVFGASLYTLERINSGRITLA